MINIKRPYFDLSYHSYYKSNSKLMIRINKLHDEVLGLKLLANFVIYLLLTHNWSTC